VVDSGCGEAAGLICVCNQADGQFDRPYLWTLYSLKREWCKLPRETGELHYVLGVLLEQRRTKGVR
jgi:hypothetical protein